MQAAIRMKTKTIKELLKGIPAKIPETIGREAVAAVEYDSRKIEKGGLFVAISGFKVDGHTFLPQVQRQGALAAVVERKTAGVDLPQIVVDNSRQALARISANFYSESIAALKLIGITGTNGKTTTSNLLYHILSLGEKKVHFTGNDRYTRQILDQVESIDKNDLLLMEISNRQLVNFKHAPHIGVITNILPNHIEEHGSYENYIQTKFNLFLPG